MIQVPHNTYIKGYLDGFIAARSPEWFVGFVTFEFVFVIVIMVFLITLIRRIK